MEKVTPEHPISQKGNPTVAELASSPLFKPALRTLSLTECTKLSYRRAKAFSDVHVLTMQDLQYMTPKFCKMHLEPLGTLDGGALTLLTIQNNLFNGTLAPFAVKRPELQPILQAAMNFEVSKSFKAMNERCGWHGHFEHNQLLQLELEMRGASTAEGDLRVLAIRLASELLIGRYQMPPPKDPTSYIAQHEVFLISEAKALLGGPAKRDHRSEGFNRDILPLSLSLAEAIGYRLAFEAAQEANIDPKILNLYESGVIKEDSAWYAEKGGLSRELQREMESQAADDLLPHLKGIMQDSGLQDYCNAPMTSKALWNEFVYGLETFEGNASPYLLARL